MLRSHWGQAVLKNVLSCPEFFNDEDSSQPFLIGECYEGCWCFPMGSVLFIVCIVQTDVFWGDTLYFSCFLLLALYFMMCK